jgi:ribosomal-protein-alanine N-acetyltransferase
MSINQAFETFPILETTNLLLRRIKPSDSTAFYGILSDEQVTKFYDDDPFSDLSQAVDQLNSWETGYQNHFCIRWGITRTDDTGIIGTCGFYGIHTWYKRASIGYELARSHWRQGIMTEALRAIMDYGFSEMGLNRIDAFVIPENTASIKMLEKLGFHNEGLLAEYERWGSKGFVDLHVFAILRKSRPSITSS